MRKINLSTLYAGPRGSWGPGVCEVPDDIAKGLIENNLAVPVRAESRAAVKPAEEVAEEEVAEEEASKPHRRGRAAVKPEEDPKDS